MLQNTSFDGRSSFFYTQASRELIRDVPYNFEDKYNQID